MRIFVCGDVMIGRGIDQALPYPADPLLYESYVRDAREYLHLAEAANGPIPRPLDFPYVWGDALEELQSAKTDARIINLETSITCADEPCPKGINYRMNPRNIGCITSARIDCCCLANNHMLDWGYEGLTETLRTLDNARVAHAGAGRNAAEAAEPAIIDLAGKGRVLTFAFGSTTSGIPAEWVATEKQAGLHILPDLSDETARSTAAGIISRKRPGDVVVASIHWGGNWGYDVTAGQVNFAHRLVEYGVDLVHGHSSHHFKAVEIYRDRLILYGCGDFITDYEGIGGYEEFRSSLALMYLAKMDVAQARLAEVRLIPMELRRFRLNRSSRKDAQWVCEKLNDISKPFATEAELQDDNNLVVRLRS